MNSSFAMNAALALAWREIIRFFRQRSRIVGSIGTPLVFWLLFGAGLSSSFRMDAGERQQSFLTYFFPGSLLLIVLFTAIFSSISIIEDRREGFLQGVLVAPISRGAIVLGKVTGGAVLAVVQAVLFLALAPFMGLTISAATCVAVLLFLVLLGYALTALGFLIAWPLDSTQGFHAIMSIFLFPMWLLSGAFFPAGDSGWLSWIIWANPLTYGVAGLRRLLYAGQLQVAPGFPPFGTCLTVTVIFCCVCLALSAWLAERRTSRDTR